MSIKIKHEGHNEIIGIYQENKDDPVYIEIIKKDNDKVIDQYVSNSTIRDIQIMNELYSDFIRIYKERYGYNM